MNAPAKHNHTIHQNQCHFGWNNANKPVVQAKPGETIEFHPLDASAGPVITSTRSGASPARMSTAWRSATSRAKNRVSCCLSPRRRTWRGGFSVVGLEVRLTSSADGAEPGVWDFVERGPGRDPSVGVALVRATASDVLAALETQPLKDALRKSTDDAIARGVFGAPAIFVGNQLFWGNDRLDFVEAALRAHDRAQSGVAQEVHHG